MSWCKQELPVNLIKIKSVVFYRFSYFTFRVFIIDGAVGWGVNERGRLDYVYCGVNERNRGFLKMGRGWNECSRTAPRR